MTFTYNVIEYFYQSQCSEYHPTVCGAFTDSQPDVWDCSIIQPAHPGLIVKYGSFATHVSASCPLPRLECLVVISVTR